MPFLFHTPAPPLGDCVHRIWNATYAPSHRRVRILPSATTELVINLSDDQIRIYGSPSQTGYQQLSGIVVAGAYATALDIDPMPNASILGIQFKPGGAFRFFGPAIRELTNTHLDLESLWGSNAIALREKLCAARTPQARLQILETALQQRLAAAAGHPAVTRAMQFFGPTGGSNSVRTVAKQVGLSERRLIQLFKAHVGLTPKLYSRILRFQHVRKMTSEASAPNWCQLALVCGYYDQSHLIRDFQAFSGLSPTEYLQRRRNAQFPNLVVDDDLPG